MSPKESTVTIPPPPFTATTESLLLQVKSLFSKLNLPPPEQLDSSTSSSFGRNIESELMKLGKQNEAMLLKLRRHNTAVVMNVDQYEQVLQIVAACKQLFAVEAEMSIAEAAGNYDALYAQISSPHSRSAADALFSASAKDLRKTYQPGKTEAK